MADLTTRERFRRMLEHKEADRIPITDSPWSSTIERWRCEGMPADVSWVDYFDVDHVVPIGVDITPQYPAEVVEDAEDYTVFTTGWGATLKNWKHANSTPEFLNFTVTDPDAWAEAKRRMTPTRDRVNWEHLEKNYPVWREKGYWIEAQFWFGFDVTHSWMVGTERFLFALVENPEWCTDIFNTYLDMDIALFDTIREAGYEFDMIRWPDDLGYKHNQFMSLDMFRELIKPVHKRAIDWAHSRGVYAGLHSCGDVNPFVPEWVEMGLDLLNPLEVKAGMDPVALKKTWGDDLTFHGGINAVLWDDVDAITAEMEKVIPAMKEDGGYVFSSDHSVPSSVRLENFRHIVNKAKELGSYE